MKRKVAFSLILLVLLIFVSQTEAAGWVRWDGNEFPENFEEGAVFTSGGSGTREIVNEPPEPGDPNVPNYALEARHISGPIWGTYHYTTPEVWTDQDSTIEIRIQARAYCAQMANCADPDVEDIIAVTIQNQDPNYVLGFRWSLVGGNGGDELIRAFEDDATYVDFPNLHEYFTYRIFYYAGTVGVGTDASADLYVWNKSSQQWDYLLSSIGRAANVRQAGLYLGDWDQVTMAGQYRIDYQSWTNDGLISLPEFCGDTGTVFKTGDLSRDCKVNLTDYSLFAQQWMECTDPGEADCQ